MQWSLKRVMLCVAVVGTLIASSTRYYRQHERERADHICLFNTSMLHSAIDEYYHRRGKCPPEYSTDDQGQPLLSWRVLILPELGYDALYKQFHLDEPWDSPHNLSLISQMPAQYQCPHARDGHTSYVAVRQSKAGWFVLADKADVGYPIQEITGEGVIWTSPNDASYVLSAAKHKGKPHSKTYAFGISRGHEGCNRCIIPESIIPKQFPPH